MQTIEPKSSPDAAVSGVSRQSLAVLLLTSVHHAYGAYVYSTPWRYHVVPVAGATALVLLGARAELRAHPSGPRGRIARWLFGLTALAVPVLLIGAFEGLYNHVVKDVLYFAGLPAERMARLFPPPKYEMPDDALFEITGVLQVVPAALAARHLYRMVAERSDRPAAPVVRPAQVEDGTREEAHAAG